MMPNLSTYPPTQKGVTKLVQDLTPKVIRLWKKERKTLGDDLVVLIDTSTNEISLKPRNLVYSKLKKRNSKVELLERLTRPASIPNGAISIWSVVWFSGGLVCILPPMVLARS